MVHWSSGPPFQNLRLGHAYSGAWLRATVGNLGNLESKKMLKIPDWSTLSTPERSVCAVKFDWWSTGLVVHHFRSLGWDMHIVGHSWEQQLVVWVTLRVKNVEKSWLVYLSAPHNNVCAVKIWSMVQWSSGPPFQILRLGHAYSGAWLRATVSSLG